MISEIRMLICTWLIGFIIHVAPNNSDGHMLVIILKLYLQAAIKKYNQQNQ